MAAVAEQIALMAEEILIASDHAGFEMKAQVEAELRKLGYAVKDFGTNSAESTDYAEFVPKSFTA